MSHYQKVSFALLRISLGWLFFYAGITKVLNPEWSAAGYLQSAKTFSGFYAWIASPGILPITNFINEWGLTLLGALLILGLGVRWISIFGAVIMVLYYFPILEFPYPSAHAYIVDEHIVYAAALLVLSGIHSEHLFSLGKWAASLKSPMLRKIFR